MKKIIIFVLLIFSIQFSRSQPIKAGGNFDIKGYYEKTISFSADGRHAVISAIKEDDKNGRIIFFELSLEKTGKWSAAKPIEDINNYKGGNSYINFPTLNRDGSKIYFEANFDDETNIDIYYSEKTKDHWSAPKALGAPINTSGYDGQPSVTTDESTIYFTRINEAAEIKGYKCRKIMVSYKQDNGKWTTPKPLPKPINLECEATPRILSDDKTLLLSSIREGGKGGFDIYYAKKISDKVWILPTAIDTINTEYEDYSPCLSVKENKIYFTKLYKKKREGTNLVYKFDVLQDFKPDNYKLVKGKITDINTGKPLNADIIISDPKTSIIAQETKTNPNTGDYNFILPYSKNFLVDVSAPGYSHFFFTETTKRIKDNIEENRDIQLYSEINLLMNVFDKDIFEPIDAKIDVTDQQGNNIDTKITKVAKGRYYITLDIGKTYNINIKNPVYASYTLPFDLTGVVQFKEFERDVELISQKKEIKLQVVDENTQKGVEVEVEVINLTTTEKYITRVKTDENGKVSLALRKGDKYEINISPKGYSFYNTSLDLSDEKKKVQEKIEVKLKPLKKDAKLELKNITFETNSADLNASSFEELDRVVKLMKDNPDIKIEISAHTDDVGSEAYNLKLSNKRAESVVNYLIDKGITYNRLVSKGYGESKPLVPNTSEENRAMNRRVELKILESDK